MSQKIVNNWLSLAEYDLATAQDMLKATASVCCFHVPADH